LPSSCPIAAVNVVPLSAPSSNASRGHEGIFASCWSKIINYSLGSPTGGETAFVPEMMAHAGHDAFRGVILRTLK
jgi:hypothetical protein